MQGGAVHSMACSKGCPYIGWRETLPGSLRGRFQTFLEKLIHRTLQHQNCPWFSCDVKRGGGGQS